MPMEPSALTLLENDATARRLVAVWPRVGAWKDGGDSLLAWSKLSGVPPREIVRLKDMLFGNEICFAAGGADRNALNYIAQLAAAKLPKQMEPPRRKRRRGRRG